MSREAAFSRLQNNVEECGSLRSCACFRLCVCVGLTAAVLFLDEKLWWGLSLTQFRQLFPSAIACHGIRVDDSTFDLVESRSCNRFSLVYIS